MMLPSFDLQGGAGMALVRAGWVAGLLSLTGSLTFATAVMPRVHPLLPAQDGQRIAHRLRRCAQASLVAGLVCGIAWLILQTRVMAAPRPWAAAIPVVAAHTRFGHLLLLQCLALALACGALAWGSPVLARWAGSGLAWAALLLQAGHGHAAAMAHGPSLLLAADIVHLAAAAGWLGGLLPLLLVVQAAPPRAAAAAARGFSTLGKICVAALAGSAAVQAWVLAGSLSGILATAYGWMILVKLALFVVLLGFACANRYRFSPALLTTPALARKALIRSIAVQSCFGLTVVAAAAVLSTLPPAMSMRGE